MKTKPYYLGRRDNPQLPKPYFKDYGQLSKADVKRKENSIYGSMTLIPFETEELYKNEIGRLKSEGFKVYKD